MKNSVSKWVAKQPNNSKKDFLKAIGEYSKNDTIIPFHLKGMEKIDKKYIINSIGFYCYNAITSTRQVHIQKYIDVNAQLLSVLRKEYHLN